MANWHKSYLKLMPIDLNLLSHGPVHLDKFTAFWELRLWIEARDKERLVQFLNIFKRLAIKVIVVVVADEDTVNGRKAVDFASWHSIPLGANPLEGRAPEGEDGVYHEVGLITDRNDSSWVSDPSVRDLILWTNEFRSSYGQEPFKLFLILWLVNSLLAQEITQKWTHFWTEALLIHHCMFREPRLESTFSKAWRLSVGWVEIAHLPLIVLFQLIYRLASALHRLDYLVWKNKISVN